MTRTVGNPVFQKYANSMLILNALRQGPLSRTELSGITGLQPSTVTYSTARLLDAGLVVESGSSASAGQVGRRRCVLSLNGDFGRFAGVEMMESSFRLVLCNMTGAVVFKDEVRYQSVGGDARELFLVRLAQAEELAVGSCGGKPLLGLGFSVPAVVSDDGASVVESWCHGLRGEDFREHLESLGFDARFENDARLCALSLSGLGNGDIAYCHVKAAGLSSISVGIGLFLGGRLYRGSQGRSGEYRSSQIAGLGLPPYNQIPDAADKEGSVRQIVGDLLCLASVLDVTKIYLNSDQGLETLFRSEIGRLEGQGDLPPGLIECSASEWDSAMGGALMMVEKFYALPQVGDIVSKNHACDMATLIGG